MIEIGRVLQVMLFWQYFCAVLPGLLGKAYWANPIAVFTFANVGAATA